MKAWIFNHHAITPDLPGGTRHYDLGREIVRRGHRVTIFASSFHHGLHREVRLAPGERWRVEDVGGVRFVWIRTFAYQGNDWRRVLSMVTYMLRARRLGRRLPKLVPEIGKPDVVIGSSVHLLAVVAAYWVARRHRARFVMEVRDLWPQTLIDMGELNPRHPVTKALQALERFLYRRAERIISLLPRAAEYITALGVPQEKIVWIPNGVDLSHFPVLDPGRPASERFTVMYLGAHGQANALEVVLEAARILQTRGHRETRFILIGGGPEKPRLMGLAKEWGLENVEFRPAVTKAEVPKTLQESRALLFNLEAVDVLKYGISSNKLFDYMTSSRPVISSVRAANNPVEEARCGVTVPPDDAEALADAVARLSAMPHEELKAMGQRARAYVEEHHDIRKLAERLERVLLDVVRGA